MKENLYCVHDSCAKKTMPPFSSPNDDCAKRDFVVGALMAQTPLQDLQLWRIATVSAADGLDEGLSICISEHKELINPTLAEVAEYKESCKDFLATVPTLDNMPKGHADFGTTSDDDDTEE